MMEQMSAANDDSNRSSKSPTNGVPSGSRLESKIPSSSQNTTGSFNDGQIRPEALSIGSESTKHPHLELQMCLFERHKCKRMKLMGTGDASLTARSDPTRTNSQKDQIDLDQMNEQMA